MSKSKREWKKHAVILRIERNNGDVSFEAAQLVVGNKEMAPSLPKARFESLTDAEKHLDDWWAGWWPVQIKHTRRV